ncbi:NAD(P)/FAD-dependent oxidoreductase [Thiolinea disciformis]|uniref:NAD(P)/FAD-dependent oxidoreductase n=1 Tax=Thiolinea disciformis TaxID=125614 RepID=UPI00036A5385|nr:FAD-dependent oxidoreductase [Thiolinea disciformis]
MKDVIIVGGGLKGLLSALFLHDAGLSVMICDRSELGRESSWAGNGLTVANYPWRMDEAVSTLTHYGQQHYPALCERLRAETGIDAQWQKTGLLFPDIQDRALAQHWAALHQQRLLLLEHPSEVKQHEPNISPTIECGLYFPEIGQIRSPRLIAALRASIRSRSILVSEHYPVTQLHVEHGEAKGIYLGDWLFEAKQVILTAGAWTPNLLPEVIKASVSVRAVAAQSILYRGSPHLLQRSIVHNNKYLVPREDGRIICGSVYQTDSFDTSISEQASEDLHQFAVQLLPALSYEPIRDTWSSVFALTPNGIPYIGPHPELAGLSLAIGHGNMSVATSLASARLLADQVLGKTSFTNPSAYHIKSRTLQPSAAW